VPNSQILNANEKFLKEVTECYSNEHMNYKKRPFSEMGKILVWIEGQTSDSKPMPNPEQGPNFLFNSVKVRQLQKKNWKLAEVGSLW
jgi:hypothetical protein